MIRSTKCKKTRIYYKQKTPYLSPNNWEALVLDFSNLIDSQMILDFQPSNTKKQSSAKSRKGIHIIWISPKNLTGHKISIKYGIPNRKNYQLWTLIDIPNFIIYTLLRVISPIILLSRLITLIKSIIASQVIIS